MPGLDVLFGIIPVIVIVLFLIGSSVRILREYERGVIFRLGKKARSVFNPGGDGLGPGLLLLIPFLITYLDYLLGLGSQEMRSDHSPCYGLPHACFAPVTPLHNVFASSMQSPDHPVQRVATNHRVAAWPLFAPLGSDADLLTIT